jgi:hypothetical protein
MGIYIMSSLSAIVRVSAFGSSGCFICLLFSVSVTSGSDPRGTRNADEDGGLSGVRRRGLRLVDTRITWRSKWGLKVRARTCKTN